MIPTGDDRPIRYPLQPEARDMLILAGKTAVEAYKADSTSAEYKAAHAAVETIVNAIRDAENPPQSCG